ncbi:MAG: hypothetical protein M3P85_05350 [Actinomycetota bacterium]|nr:hypothetical protein [Actinomycetota bacterium]PLS74837.1 MAG: hypothetical protein CYG61_10570 [Actinomycetota bacterium]
MSETAEKILDNYGAPNEATPTKLLWYRVGPWSRMELTADEVVHNFPTPHTDYLTQYVAPAPYAERLLFEPPEYTADPDEAIVASGMAHQMVEKVKDVFGAGRPPQ